MNRDRFKQIFEENDSIYQKDKKCEVLQGLKIMEKYVPTAGIKAAEHDEVYSEGIDDLIEGGITEEDALKLRHLGWRIGSFDSLEKFV